MRTFVIASFLSVVVALVGCERPSSPSTPPAGGSSGSAKKDDHAGHDHEKEANDKHGAGHGGEVIELGTTKVGGLTVRASRDKGEIKPGGDAPIDLWVTDAAGKAAAVSAVRFWLGTEDAKGSLKAKAEIEDPKQPDHWHTHVEVPNPIPAAMKLWVELEAKDGKQVVSFDLTQ